MSSQQIRHNITIAYHPQTNGEVERFNRTTQEAFLKCQEFSDKVKEADVDWHKKLKKKKKHIYIYIYIYIQH